MQVHVKFFALFREYVGMKEDWPEVEPGTTVGALWQHYVEVSKNSRVAGIRAAYSVNQKLATADTLLKGGEEVGFLPPVSGGAAAARRPRRSPRAAKKTRGRKPVGEKRKAAPPGPRAVITSRKLALAPLVRMVEHAEAGAIVTFTGTVRDSAHGKAVAFLEYEAYAEMAAGVLEQTLQEAEKRWPLVRAAAAHRTGHLEIGAASLMIAVSSPHRPEAFAACRYILERVKSTLPVWKKEFASDGEYWVEGPVAGDIPAEEAEAIAQAAEDAVL